jgi:hypothetical protein
METSKETMFIFVCITFRYLAMKSRSTTELAIMGLLCAFLLVPYFSVMNNISKKIDDDEDDRILKGKHQK